MSRPAPGRVAPEIARLTRGEAAGPLSPHIDEAPLNLEVLERRTILRALVATGGHRARAARILGMCERTLRNKLKVS
jgi:DNA-binding NtrC family response regulator